MSLSASSFWIIALRQRLSLGTAKTYLVFGFLLFSAGCATYEKESEASPLIRAEHRLDKAEKIKLNTEGQAAEYLAVARIASDELAANRVADVPARPEKATTLYNRAVADLATDLPALIREKKDSSVFRLRDQKTGADSNFRLRPPTIPSLGTAVGATLRIVPTESSRIGVLT